MTNAHGADVSPARSLGAKPVQPMARNRARSRATTREPEHGNTWCCNPLSFRGDACYAASLEQKLTGTPILPLSNPHIFHKGPVSCMRNATPLIFLRDSDGAVFICTKSSEHRTWHYAGGANGTAAVQQSPLLQGRRAEGGETQWEGVPSSRPEGPRWIICTRESRKGR